MNNRRWLAVFDTPSIKQYVFGTDLLREIRGSSANLADLSQNNRAGEPLAQSALVPHCHSNCSMKGCEQ